jgi:CubicO group peptidase (beta-lactamase class C family)
VDHKVSAYLEGTPSSWSEVTVAHLLTQTSGMKDFINEPTASLRLEVTDEEVFKATAPRPLNFPPGERYAYSNSNYHLLAMMIAKLTGKTYGQFLKERIFDPLGMSRTRVVSWSDIIPGRAAGYVHGDGKVRNGEFVAGSILAYGGGGLLSTAEDMAKWDLALRGGSLLPQESLQQMWSPARLNGGGQSGYGFGWGVGGAPGHRHVQHSGGHITGFTSHIVRFLDDDLSVIVLANYNRADPARLAHAIAGFFIPELRPPPRKAIPDGEPKVTALLRRITEMVREGRLEDGIFTPDLHRVVEGSLDSTSEAIKQAGLLRGVELLERSRRSDGQVQYVYRVQLEELAALVTMVVNKDGKIARLDTEIE